MSATPLSIVACRCPLPAPTATTPPLTVGSGDPPLIVHGAPVRFTSGTCAGSAVPGPPVNVSWTNKSTGTGAVVNDHRGPVALPPAFRAVTCQKYVVLAVSP